MNCTERARKLQRIVRGIRRCRKCPLHASRTHAVPGAGDPHADVMFVGEGPGEAEDQQGRPFVGRSGRFLDEVLPDLDPTRERLFVTSTVKCRPPENRNPRRAECDTCRNAWLDDQSDCVRPKLVVLLGQVALRAVTGDSRRLADLHGPKRPRGAEPPLTYPPPARCGGRASSDASAGTCAPRGAYTSKSLAAAWS